MADHLAFTIENAFVPGDTNISLLHILNNNNINYIYSPTGQRPRQKNDISIAWVMMPLFEPNPDNIDEIRPGTENRGMKLMQLVVTIDVESQKFENPRFESVSHVLRVPPDPPAPITGAPPPFPTSWFRSLIRNFRYQDNNGSSPATSSSPATTTSLSSIEHIVRIAPIAALGRAAMGPDISFDWTRYKNVGEFSNRLTPQPEPGTGIFNHQQMQFFSAKHEAYIFSRSSLLAVLSHMSAIAANDGPVPQLYFSGYKIATGKMTSDMAMLELNYLKKETRKNYDLNYGIKAEVVTPARVIISRIENATTSLPYTSVEQYFTQPGRNLPLTAYGIPCPPNYGIHGVLVEVFVYLSAGNINTKSGIDLENLDQTIEAINVLIKPPS